MLIACNKEREEISAEELMAHVEAQVNFGPRIPGSQSSFVTATYIERVLTEYGWQVEFQEFQHQDTTIRNIIARNRNSTPRIILGAHYDTRRFSDQEKNPTQQQTPVPGANDGASGTALLLELGRVLANSNNSIWLVFFDAEDQGHINNWEWSLGANYFADYLSELPESVVVVDMIGDRDLNLYLEKNSDDALCQEIWEIAGQLGYQDIFISEEKYAMIDDHLPFIDKGIPSCLLIDFDYPHWHKNSDSIDHVSAKNLRIVGEVLFNWVLSP